MASPRSPTLSDDTSKKRQDTGSGRARKAGKSNLAREYWSLYDEDEEEEVDEDDGNEEEIKYDHEDQVKAQDSDQEKGEDSDTRATRSNSGDEGDGGAVEDAIRVAVEAAVAEQSSKLNEALGLLAVAEHTGNDLIEEVAAHSSTHPRERLCPHEPWIFMRSRSCFGCSNFQALLLLCSITGH